MTAEPLTVIIASAAAVAVVALVYGVTTLQRHDDRANRLAAASFLATFVGLVGAPLIGRVGVVGVSGDRLTAPTVAAVVLALGATAGAGVLWAATQCFARREPMLGLVAVGSVVAGVAALLAVRAAPDWELLPAAVGAALGYAFAAVELRRSPMASNLNSVLLEAVLWCAAAGSVVIAAYRGIGELRIEVAWAALASALAVITVVAAMALMALRVERYGTWWSLGDDHDASDLGVHEAEAFAVEARDRLERCLHAGQPAHVITTALPGLVELNLAYGHLVGDGALRWVAALLRRQAPPSAVLGHLGAGRFAIVTSRDPELVANAVQNGMMRVPPPATLPVRLTPVFAWASSDEAGYDLELLRQTAEERLTHVV